MKKNKWLLLIPIVIGALTLAIYTIRTNTSFREEMKIFYANEMSGKVVSFANSGKGFATIVVERNGTLTEFDLPNIRQYLALVSINDSLYKPINSHFINVYKHKDNLYQYCCQMGPIRWE